MPRASARAKTPLATLGLKKYDGGTSPITMSDNDDTSPLVRDGSFDPVHSDILSVKNAVGEPIPAPCQRSEEGSKRPSSVIRQDASDVFPYDPLGREFLSKRCKSE